MKPRCRYTAQECQGRIVPVPSAMSGAPRLHKYKSPGEVTRRHSAGGIIQLHVVLRVGSARSGRREDHTTRRRGDTTPHPHAAPRPARHVSSGLTSPRFHGGSGHTEMTQGHKTQLHIVTQQAIPHISTPMSPRSVHQPLHLPRTRHTFHRQLPQQPKHLTYTKTDTPRTGIPKHNGDAAPCRRH